MSSWATYSYLIQVFFFLFTKIINFAICMSINNVVLSLLTAFNIHFMVHQVI